MEKIPGDDNHDLESQPSFKRTYYRMPCNIQCLVHNKALDNKLSTGTIQDISGGGLKMISKTQAEPHTYLQLKFRFMERELDVTAEVMAVELDSLLSDKQKKNYWVLRLKFSEISLENRLYIIKGVRDYKMNLLKNNPHHKDETTY